LNMEQAARAFIARRQKLRLEIGERWRREIQLSYAVLEKLLQRGQAEGIFLNTHEKRVACFMTLKVARTFQSIVALFENGLVQDAHALLRPLIETSVDAVYVFADTRTREERLKAYAAHLARSSFKFESRRRRNYPETEDGSREEYMRELEADLAKLPEKSRSQNSWTTVTPEDRVRAVDRFIVENGDPPAFRNMVKAWGDGHQLLHSDIAGSFFYMEPTESGQVQLVPMGPRMPKDHVVIDIGLPCLLNTMMATSDVLVPGMKDLIVSLGHEVRREFRDLGKQGTPEG
jgi:hypothetical protein